MSRFETSIEFLTFIADVSDPGTGMILPDRLATRLGVSVSELEEQWRASCYCDWAAFADGVLSVLDVLQDRTHSLKAAVQLYRRGRILPDCETIERRVVRGMASQVLRDLRGDASLERISLGQKAS